MSTSDRPETPPLTRRQLREIRNTGTTPVLTAADIAEHAAASTANDDRSDDAAMTGPDAATTDAAATDAATTDAGATDAGATDAAVAESARAPIADVPEPAVVDPALAEIRLETAAPEPAVGPVAPLPTTDLGVTPLTRRQAREHERIRTASVPIITPDSAAPPSASDAQSSVSAPAEAPARAEAPAEVIAAVPGPSRATVVADDDRPAAQVNPHFGSGLLAGATPVVDLPPSFDQLIARNGSVGGSSAPNALILSQTPSTAPLVAPVTATGEVLITGTFDLPEGLGSVGHAPGVHDGKEADSVLVDGELPAASSPTPIAASAAISTIRSSDEIIRPPAPERGSRLVLVLGITAGVLGLVLISALALVFTTGVL